MSKLMDCYIVFYLIMKPTQNFGSKCYHVKITNLKDKCYFGLDGEGRTSNLCKLLILSRK